MNQQTTPPLPTAETLSRLGLDEERRGFWTRNKLLLIGGVVALALVAGYALFWSQAGNTAYETVEAVRTDLLVSVSATGTLQPENQVDVGPEISGRIERVLVDFNDIIAEGDILAELDTEQLDARLAQSNAALNAARASVSQNEATLEQARATSARAESLYERMIISEQDLETARADLQRAQANLRRARADAELAAAQVDADGTTLSRAVIRSPISGVVLDRLVEPGQTVAASFQTPVMFTLASDLSRMELIVDIDEADIGSVREGQQATFTVDAFPNRQFAAELVSVRNAPTIENGVVTYKGVLTVDNSSGLLRPGLTANADIVTAEIKDSLFVPNGALLVPNGALRFTPSAEDIDNIPPYPGPANGQTSGRVWVLEGGTPAPRDLVVGLSDGQWTEIISGDLEVGEEVITDIRDPNAP